MEKLLKVLIHEEALPKSIDLVLSFLIFSLRRELVNRDDLIRVSELVKVDRFLKSS